MLISMRNKAVYKCGDIKTTNDVIYKKHLNFLIRNQDHEFYLKYYNLKHFLLFERIGVQHNRVLKTNKALTGKNRSFGFVNPSFKRQLFSSVLKIIYHFHVWFLKLNNSEYSETSVVISLSNLSIQEDEIEAKYNFIHWAKWWRPKKFYEHL